VLGGAAVVGYLWLASAGAPPHSREPANGPSSVASGEAEQDTPPPGGSPSAAATGQPPPAIAVPDRVTVTEGSIVYRVQGSSAGALRAALNVAGPVDTDGGRHDGHCNWYVRWSYPFQNDASGCRTGPVMISIEVTYTLPQWVEPAQADATLSADWKRYMRALTSHEQGHRDIALRAGIEIQQRLETLAAQRTCPALDQLAGVTANAALDSARRSEKEYDRQTGHGATQGARFPCTPVGAGCKP
jgi:predicted secreted Zn-dependent protease